MEQLVSSSVTPLGCLESVDWTTGLDYWTGLLDWTTGLDYWTGLLDWTTGMHGLSSCKNHFS